MQLNMSPKDDLSLRAPGLLKVICPFRHNAVFPSFQQKLPLLLFMVSFRQPE